MAKDDSLKTFVPSQRGIPNGSHVVLLVGGPYNGQDIVASVEEWADGTLVRFKCRYTAAGQPSPPNNDRPLLREYHFVSSMSD